MLLFAVTLTAGFGWGVLTERRLDRGHAYVEAENALVNLYVESVDRDKIMRGCYQGMVESLGDTYAHYYTPDELAAKQAEEKKEKIDDVLQVQQIDEGGRTYALVWLGSFSTQIESEFPKRMETVVAMNPDAVILDMRGNLGGLITAASAVSGVWIGDNVMARMDNHRGDVELKNGTGEPILGHLPLAVIVNHNSASAAEIVAGALRDQLGAPLIGTQTYGKGLVQGFIPMPGGGWAKITTHWWHTPKGDSVSPNGLNPDLFVDAPRMTTYTFLDEAVEMAIHRLAE